MICFEMQRVMDVEKILTAMGSEYDSNEDGAFLIDDDQWQAWLPNDYPTEVWLRFDEKMNPAIAADLAIRFFGVASAMGLQVRSIGTYIPASDSTGSMTVEAIEQLENKN
jgi:hypothetical protein